MQGSNCGILDVQVAHKAMNHGSHLLQRAIIYKALGQQWAATVQCRQGNGTALQNDVAGVRFDLLRRIEGFYMCKTQPLRIFTTHISITRSLSLSLTLGT